MSTALIEASNRAQRHANELHITVSGLSSDGKEDLKLKTGARPITATVATELQVSSRVDRTTI